MLAGTHTRNATLAAAVLCVVALGEAGCHIDEPEGTDCTADCRSQLPGDGLCSTYNSMQYNRGTVTCNQSNCSVDTSDCGRIDTGCRPGDFCTCASPDECHAGFACREGVTTGVSICLVECNSDSTVNQCGANRECIQWSQTPGDGICLMADAARDGPCFDNYKLCAADAGDCGTAGYDYNGDDIYRCKIECEHAAIGTPGSCLGGEICFESGVVRALSPDQLCNTPGSSGTCTEGSCYDGWTGGQTRCGTPVAFCGTGQPMLGEFDVTSIQNHIDAGDGCNQIDDHRMCAPIADGNVIADDEARSVCIDVGSPTGDGVCVATCEDEQENALDCGVGFECCTPPAGDEFLFRIQLDGTTRVVCTNQWTPDVCDTDNNYGCVAGFAGGTYCARPYMMCMTPGVAGAVCL